MKKLLLLACIACLVLAGCGPSKADIQKAAEETRAAAPTRTPRPTATIGPGLYVINKSTGLYEALNINAKMIAELPEGTELIPEDEKSEVPLCSSFIDSGTTYKLCKMKVVKTGKTGWVLIQWMDLKR